MTLTAEITTALDIRNPRASEEELHRVVTNGIRDLDPQAELRRTGYFNHSWAPDFVMTWNGTGRQRFLFLRFDVAHEAFDRELDALANTSPVFLGLLGGSADGQRGATAASTLGRASETETLVTETRAVDRLRTPFTMRSS